MKKRKNITEQIRKARRGLNIFYYGKGKGKTTAIMGTAARAAGAGMKVYILQFVKSKPPKKGIKLQSGEWPQSSEIVFFEKHAQKTITTEQVGMGFVGILGDKKERAVHIKAAKEGLKRAERLIKSDKYDLIVLDEIVSALEIKLITEKDILKLLAMKPKHLHLAYSGHDYFRKIVDASDLVSEVKMIKHPYYKGMLAQRGIDF